MSFQTGTFTALDTLNTLFDTVADFALSEGWTINVRAYPNLTVTSGACQAVMIFTSNRVQDDRYGASALAASPDYCIEGRLANGPVNVNERVVANDFTPPYARYWLFGGGAVGSKYIHIVVQRANGRFSFFSFGTLDKQGAAYTGGAYMTGTFWNWGFNTTSLASTGSNEGSNINGQSHLFFGRDTASASSATYHLDLGTAGGNEVICGRTGFTSENGVLTPLVGTGFNYFDMGSTGRASSWSRWLTPMYFLGPNPVNGVTAMFDVPALRYTLDTRRLQFFGVLPGMKYCSMKGRAEGEEVSFASDEYVVVPVKQYRPWNPEPWSAKVVTSGPYGMSFLKT